MLCNVLTTFYLFFDNHMYMYCFSILCKLLFISILLLVYIILTFTNKTALEEITFVTRFLPSENKVYTYIHTYS